jgi:hypothetical protein
MNLFVTVNNSLVNIGAIACATLVDGRIVIKTMDGSEHQTEFTSLDEFQFFFQGAFRGLMEGSIKMGAELGREIEGLL